MHVFDRTAKITNILISETFLKKVSRITLFMSAKRKPIFNIIAKIC